MIPIHDTNLLQIASLNFHQNFDEKLKLDSHFQLPNHCQVKRCSSQSSSSYLIPTIQYVHRQTQYENGTQHCCFSQEYKTRHVSRVYKQNWDTALPPYKVGRGEVCTMEMENFQEYNKSENETMAIIIMLCIYNKHNEENIKEKKKKKPSEQNIFPVSPRILPHLQTQLSHLHVPYPLSTSPSSSLHFYPLRLAPNCSFVSRNTFV